ncbi:MAG: hypothetical protein OEO77_09780 [Acidimicrobiia bacterium]|nr:hypothetical protein [Acidimicrobiia bacterium]
MTDPLRHPDLVEISRRLRDRFDEVLAAEQEAAATTRRRRLTMRERLLDAEDRAETVTLMVLGGMAIEGQLTAVGADHLVVDRTDRTGRQVAVAIEHVVAIETVR